jgi:hypothetical protein
MVVAHDGKGAFKQRTYAISSHDNPSPADVCRLAVLVDQERFALEDFVVFPVHLLRVSHIAIFVEELDIGILVKNVMVGFQA